MLRNPYPALVKKAVADRDRDGAMAFGVATNAWEEGARAVIALLKERYGHQTVSGEDFASHFEEMLAKGDDDVAKE